MYHYNYIELCAGAGGLTCGLNKSGLKSILLNDMDKDCCETLRKNFPKENILCNSFPLIKEQILQLSKTNTIDIMLGGMPCQSFSMAGHRKGLNDKRGNLIIEFIDLVHEIKPKLFLIENVKGLMTLDKGEVFRDILLYISNKGIYDMCYKVLNSNDYEVAQNRERIIIVGTLKCNNSDIKFEFPIPIPKKYVLRDILTNVPDSVGALYTEKKISKFKLIPQGGCWINLPIELQKEYLGNSFYSGGGKRGILARLSMDKPSLTIMCSPSQCRTERCHPLYDRPLTTRESARIQSFPDDYVFHGSMSSVYKQIGNAVPVNLAYHIGLSIIKYLNVLNLSRCFSETSTETFAEIPIKIPIKIKIKFLNKNSSS